ncbi:MAG TPA: dephospho-CoA kinase [Spirochaetia bacterium]|nr:dephospho-CoA kinase [Spirochaetia bacterium]
MVIGVTGKYGAGKDAVTRILVGKGFTEINLDAIGHRVLEEKKKEAAAAFGDCILDEHGSVSRRRLGQIVFRDRAARSQLEALLHPRMKEIVRERLESGWGHMVINAALLFSMGLAELADAVICVTAPFPVRFFRARARDKLGFFRLLDRFRSQGEIIPQTTPHTVDIYYVTNARSIGRLECATDRLLQAIMRKPKKEE